MTKSIEDKLQKDGEKAQILGVRLDSSSFEELLRKIICRLGSHQKTFIVTPNPEFLVLARQNPWFQSILNRADIAIPDGIGLVWASRFLSLGKHLGGGRKEAPKTKKTQGVIRERICGTDLMGKLCQKAAQRGWRVYLLGAGPGVAKKALAVLKKRYPGLKGWAESGPKVKDFAPPGWRSSFFKLPSGGFLSSISGFLPFCEEKGRPCRPPRGWIRWVEKINQKKPDLLFVAFGMGKQEKFIYENWRQLKVKLAVGVGGAFDYLSGQVPRAPEWAQKAGLEWLCRLFWEPWRWRRQRNLIAFGWLVLKEKIASFRLPPTSDPGSSQV